jgi:ParB family transcriptional regulator, chromosome partitioning protein
MAIKKLGLGKNVADLGLKELLSGFNAPLPAQAGSSGEMQKLPIEFLRPGQYQPRHNIDKEALEELASSIRAQGLIQPVIVRTLSTKSYEIIAGERRWRAAQLAGLHEIPVIIRNLSNEQAMAIALIENIQREDLNVLDEALALQRLIAEFGMTHQAVAETVGKSRATVTNLLRLLELSPEVKELLAKGKIEMGHARALLGTAALAQIHIAKMIVAKGLSVRETEKLVQQQQNKKSVTPVKIRDPNIVKLEKDLSEKLGAHTSIQTINKKKGRLIITYHSLEELDGILQHIR